MNENYNDFEGGYTYTSPSGGGYGYGAEPRWDDFTLDDEKRAKGRFSRFFLATVVYLLTASVLFNVFYVIMTIVMGAEKAVAFFEDPYVNMACNVLFMYVIALPVFYLIVRGMHSVQRRREKLPFKDFLMLFLVGEACMFGGSIIGSYITDFFYLFFGIEVTDTVGELISSTPIWLVFIVAVVIGPIVEEFIFRKLLMDKLGMYGDRLAIFVSAIAFGLFHGDLNQIIYATLLGFVLAYTYSRSGNMWYCVALHSIMNFFGSIIPMLVMEPSERFLELMTMIEAGQTVDEAELARVALIAGGYSMLVYGLLIAGVCVFITNRKRIFVSDRCEVLIPKKKIFSVTVLNVGGIIFSVVCILSVIYRIAEPILIKIAEGSAG